MIGGIKTKLNTVISSDGIITTVIIGDSHSFGFSKEKGYGLTLIPTDIQERPSCLEGISALTGKEYDFLSDTYPYVDGIDYVIMNPPYCRNLHLKILNEAICYSDDIVNLSPIRWLQDPLAEHKKNSDWKKFENVRNHIESLDVITDVEAQILFSAGFLSDLCIYHLTDKGGFAIKENTIIKQ